MSEELTSYQPDTVLRQRRDENRAKNKGPITVDKPIQMRVMKTRPPTQRKHYRRKARLPMDPLQHDPRKVRFL